MGVQGLNTFIDNHKEILENYSLQSTSLIIDGHNICHQLFYTFQLERSHFFGGDYDRFAKACRNFFTALRQCDVTPYVIYDGAYDLPKFEAMKSRASVRIKTANEVSRGIDGKVTPVMLYETFRDVVDRSDIHHVTCNFDADPQMAALAIKLECPILSMDSDFLIYNVPAGVVRMDNADVEKFVREAIVGTNRNPTVKIYKVSTFCKQAGDIHPSILPLLATLLGNDRVASNLFSTFIAKINVGLPLTCGNIEAREDDSQDKKVVAILYWLKKKGTVGEVQKTLLKDLFEKYKSDVDKAIRTSMAAYTDPKCEVESYLSYPNQLKSKSTVVDTVETLLSLNPADVRPNIESAIQTSMSAYIILTCEVEGHLSDPTQLTGGGSLKSFAGKQIPNWFMVGIRNGRIPVHALDALVLRKVILPTQVSMTVSQSPYQSSAKLRQFLYSVLLVWDEPDPQQLEQSFIKEYDRDQNLELKGKKVNALLKLKSDHLVPTLETIKEKISVSDRKSLLLDVLEVTKDQLDKFKLDSHNHLLIATIVHWMKNSIPIVNQVHLESLLVCFQTAGFLGKRIQGDDDAAAFFERLRKTPGEISVGQTFCPTVVHSFAQFQCCLQMALYVNQILLLPAPDPLPVLAFNGTFLHNFYLERRGRLPGQQKQPGVEEQNSPQRNEQRTEPHQRQQVSLEKEVSMKKSRRQDKSQPDKQLPPGPGAGQQHPPCSSTAEVNSEKPNSLETVCKAVEMYKKMFLDIVPLL